MNVILNVDGNVLSCVIIYGMFSLRPFTSKSKYEIHVGIFTIDSFLLDLGVTAINSSESESMLKVGFQLMDATS